VNTNPSRRTAAMVDRKFMQEARPRIEAALAALGAEYGVVFTVGRGTYDLSGSHGHFKLEVGTVSSGGTVMTEEARTFQMLAPLWGMKEGDLGRTVVIGGKGFKVVGARGRSSKNDVILEREDGKKYVYPHEMVAALLKVA